jgi:RHS repeat-associated protein
LLSVAGNLVPADTSHASPLALHYDHLGRLVQDEPTSLVDGVANQTVNNVYNADGTRLVRQTLAVTDEVPALDDTTLYLGDGTEVHNNDLSANVTIRNYTTAAGTPVAQASDTSSSAPSWTQVFADGQDTVRLSSVHNPGATSTSTTRPVYEPYGLQTKNVALGNPADHGYLDKTLDPTGDIRLDQRDYTPELNQLTTPDPIFTPGDPLSANPYTYARNNPMTFSDPSGLAYDPNQSHPGCAVTVQACDPGSRYQGVAGDNDDQPKPPPEGYPVLGLGSEITPPNELGQRFLIETAPGGGEGDCATDGCLHDRMESGDCVADQICQQQWFWYMSHGSLSIQTKILYAPEMAELALGFVGPEVEGASAAGGLFKKLAAKLGGRTAANGGADLISVAVNDPAAKALATRLGGRASVRFAGDATGREFDTVSDLYVAQTKPANFQLGSAFRNQAKATFEAALNTGRTPYFHFEGEPGPGVVSKLLEYGNRYGIDPVIDTIPFGG